MNAISDRERVLNMARREVIFTAADVEAAGIHTQVLTRLVREGVLERLARGVYRLVDAPLTEYHSLALVAAAVPGAVVCLLSALQFHGIGSQTPIDVWIAIERRAAPPTLDYPPLRVVRFSGDAYASGIEHHTIEGQSVAVYSLAKTIADCFKYRRKIGLEIALEALSEAIEQQRVSPAELNAFARIDRVQKVMQPYVEAVIS